jgi:hypothetical protein
MRSVEAASARASQPRGASAAVRVGVLTTGPAAFSFLHHRRRGGVCGDDGVPSFDRIRYRRTTPTCSSDLRREPFEVRKATLASVVAKAAAGLRPNEHIQADGRVRPRLQDGSGGHRIEAQGAALHERPLGRPTDSRARNEELVAFVIRIVCLGLLGYWSLILIRPFLTIIIWSIIITVALYPILEWLRQNFMAIAHWRRLQLLFSPFS